MAAIATDPVTQPSQTVIADHVRVSVLTDRLVRIEYAHDAVFEDRPSLDVVHRNFPAVPFTTTRDGAALTVDTGPIRLHCTDVTRPFSATRLTATLDTTSRPWRFGAVDRHNLGGTVRTLDTWDGNRTPTVTGFDPDTGVVRTWHEQSLEPGLVSRGGWVTVDDSTSVLVATRPGRSAAARPRPIPRAPGPRTDLYLFAYGLDHQGALRDAATLFGPQPLPPRYAFGYWYSRYYPYTDRELLELSDDLDRHGVPADVIVIDMDWHRPGWTGYSWDRSLFVDPTDTLARLRAARRRVALNLHPADGVGSHEDAHEAMCAALGLDPATTERVPFAITDPAFVDAYFRLLHHPEEDRGVDVWWMDWQQGHDTDVVGLDPLAWLNLLHADDQTRRRPSRRPLIFSRWGGLGSTRTPIGFSGDTYATWSSLAHQPSFTATAANVAYGYWSHDIGGHFGSTPDPELYTRWVQFGAHSPILRTHGTLDAFQERRFWEFPNPYRTAMIDAVRHRYALVPYLYGAARRATDTGRSLIRPLYHAHPRLDAAYDAPGEYLLGDEMIVAPVTAPRHDDATTPVRVWLPPGDWYDTAHGRRHAIIDEAGRWIEERYLLEEIPVFVRAGAIIPGQRGVQRLDHPCYPNLVLSAHPGADGVDGATELYEDDGSTTGYQRDRAVWTPIRQRVRARSRRVTIGGARGRYRGWQRHRDVEVRIIGEAPPTAVTVEGATVPWSAERRRGHWWYEPELATVVVGVPRVDLRAETTVHLDRAPRSRRLTIEAQLDGYPALHRRLRAIDQASRALVGDDNRRFMHLTQAADRIARAPASLHDALAEVHASIAGLAPILAEAIEHHTKLESLRPLDPPQATEVLEATSRLLATTLARWDV